MIVPPPTPPGLWLARGADVRTAAPATVPFVVVDLDEVGQPTLQEARKKGTRVYGRYPLAWVPPGPERDRVPTEAFELSRDNAFVKDRRGVGLLALNTPEGMRIARERAARIGGAPCDAVLLDPNWTPIRTYRYGEATRDWAIENFGLDPVDFNDPADDRPFTRPDMPGTFKGVDPRFDMPEKMASGLAAVSAERTTEVARVAVRALTEGGGGWHLIAGAYVQEGGPRAAVTAYGDWRTLLPLPGLRRVWSRAALTPAGFRRLADRVGSTPLGLIGDAATRRTARAALPSDADILDADR